MPNEKSEQWIQSLVKQEDALIELICFPFAGGGTMTYQVWGELLCPQINLSAVLLPGREVRIKQMPEDDIDRVCDTIKNEILDKYASKSIAFFGHSMGSMLAYEVGRRLQEQHDFLLKCLIVSGRQAPHLHFGGDFHRSSDEVFIQELKRFGQTPDIVFEDHEMRKLILPMLRADYSLLENYRLQKLVQLSCPLLTCAGKEDTEVTPEQIQCWQDLVCEKIQHEVFSGDHFYLMSPQAQCQLVSVVNDYLLGLDVKNVI